MNVLKVKKLLLGLIAVVLIGFLLIYLLKLIEPSSPPRNIFVSNITDHQATISWTTLKPTKGVVVLAQQGKFPILPIFTKLYRDDGEKNLNVSYLYRTHTVTIGKLEPNKTYQFRIYQGWKKKYEGQFSTGSTLSSIITPNPVYGRILKADKTPAVGALVYFWAGKGASESAILSTLTNREGRWSVDISNLRASNLKTLYKIASSSAEQLIVDYGGKARFSAETAAGKDKPWPNLILK